MTPLARFTMAGPSQAALVAAGFALLSVVIPLFGLISAGAVGLVTLRNGPMSGLLVMGLATLGAGVFSALALGSPWVGLGILVALWLPVWGLGAILRATRSLALTLQVAGITGLLLVFLVYGLVDDPVDHWNRLMEPLRQALVADGVVQEATSQALFLDLASWMTGAFAAALLFQSLMSLFIARWWQAALYNPGGFGEEFRSLRLSRLIGGLVLLLLAGLTLVRGPGPLADLILVFGVLLLVQGLAVAHGLRRLKGGRQAWLIGLYVFLVLFMPQSVVLIACVGLIDVWIDIRARAMGPVSGER